VQEYSFPSKAPKPPNHQRIYKMSAYINQLKQLNRSNYQPTLSLRKKIIDWHRNLPEVSRSRPFSMQEIEDAVNSQGRYISAVLLELG